MTSPRAYNASGKALKKRPNNRVKIELQNLLNLLSSETLMKPWQKYTVGVPAAKGWNNDCSPFSTISHTSHVESALKILDDDKIKAGLVFDDSILNKKRILVSWLSPNTWGTGYRYGNIKFEFDFKNLIKTNDFIGSK